MYILYTHLDDVHVQVEQRLLLLKDVLHRGGQLLFQSHLRVVVRVVVRVVAVAVVIEWLV